MSEPDYHSSKRLGGGMLAVAWIILLILLSAYFGVWESEQRNPNQTPVGEVTASGERLVALQRNRYNHYVVSGEINGEEVEFILDTGATDVVVSEELAEQLGLPRGRHSYAVTANGTVAVVATRLEQLRIANIVLHDVPASINPAMYGNEVLLGMSALKQVEFTQRDGQLVLKQR